VKENVYLLFLVCLLQPFSIKAQEDSTGSLAPDAGQHQGAAAVADQTGDPAIKADALRMAQQADELAGKAARLYASAQKLDSLGMKEHADAIRSKAAGLQAKADELKKKSDMLYQDACRYNPALDRTERDRGYFRRQAYTMKDTIHYISREGARELLNSFTKKRSARERGYGGGISLMPGIFAVNISEVKELRPILPVKYAGALSAIEGRYETFFLMGAAGYGGLGNGLRIGGGGFGGSRVYSTQYGDTTALLELSAGFGGVLIEKCFVSRNMNTTVGGMLGGGNLTVLPSFTTDAFSDLDDLEDNEANALKAGFLLLEFHGGFTYTMVTWLHLGLDLSAPLFIATDGFKGRTDRSYTSGFFTINPGLKIKIVVGNLG